MNAALIFQKLSFFMLIFDVLQRVLLFIVNGIRMLLSEDYRKEVFGETIDDDIAAAKGAA